MEANVDTLVKQNYNLLQFSNAPRLKWGIK